MSNGSSSKYAISLKEMESVLHLIAQSSDSKIKLEGEKQRIIVSWRRRDKTNSASSHKLSKNESSKQHKSGSRSSKERSGSKLSSNNGSGKKKHNDDLNELLSIKTTMEQVDMEKCDELSSLLSIPTVKEAEVSKLFKSHKQVREFCKYGTREECLRKLGSSSSAACKKLHFRKILKPHTDESLGDCSFLNTCFHMDTCKYVHYEIDSRHSSKQSGNHHHHVRSSDHALKSVKSSSSSALLATADSETLKRKMLPAQWICCDIRYIDFSVLGKFSVIMADPPWDIHMELPYGTMQDDEMRSLRVHDLSDDGMIFLWVTGRAMELGRELLGCWGYKQCDELIWVKTNQLQRLIRTGRTGHWMNHGKEHCLIGIKGSPENINRRLDCDVLVAEVRDTSHKPDEIYGIIERLSPGTRKLELFGRGHNIQPNWVTLGNQLDGVSLVESDVVSKFKAKYPDGKVPKPLHLIQKQQQQQNNNIPHSPNMLHQHHPPYRHNHHNNRTNYVN